jgi:DNA-binding IclR family transcriptional regulator
MPSDPHTPAIQVLERTFALLDMLASHRDPISLKEISELTGLHPSTAHRILNDLTIGRYVDRPQAGSYRLGMRLLELGNLVKARLDVREAALAPMRELHKLTHQPVNLSMRQGDEIVYVERAYSERSGMQVVRAIGGRAPLHLTSVGKLFLAHDDPQRVRAYATRTGLAGHTRNSITELPRLERELAAVRANAAARDDEELETRRALHGRRDLRRPGHAGGRAVDLRPGRPAGGSLAREGAVDGGEDLRRAGLPRLRPGGSAPGSSAPGRSAQAGRAGRAGGAGQRVARQPAAQALGVGRRGPRSPPSRAAP